MNRTLHKILRHPVVDHGLRLASRVLDVLARPLDHLLGIPALLEGRMVEDAPPGTDALVVFGCGYVTAHVHIDERLDAALRLWAAHPELQVMATGADWNEDYQETRYMRDYLVRAGVPKQLVVRDGRGTTTVNYLLNLRRSMRAPPGSTRTAPSCRASSGRAGPSTGYATRLPSTRASCGCAERSAAASGQQAHAARSSSTKSWMASAVASCCSSAVIVAGSSPACGP